MTFALREFLSPITYWPPVSPDGAGGLVYGAPRLVYGHYEEMLQRVNVDGIEVESNASACVEEDLFVGGLLLNGNHIDIQGGETSTNDSRYKERLSKSRERARRIIKFMKVPGVVKVLGNIDRTAYV